MQNDNWETPDAGVVRDFPLAPNRANLTLRTLADVYTVNFAGDGDRHRNARQLPISHLIESASPSEHSTV